MAGGRPCLGLLLPSSSWGRVPSSPNPSVGCFTWWGSALDVMGLPNPRLGVSCGGGPPLPLRGVLTTVLAFLHRGGLASTSWGVTTPVAGTSRCSELVSGGAGKGEMAKTEPRISSWFVFVTHRVGLPLPGSPLLFLPPISVRRARSSWPTSLRRGEGRTRLASVVLSEVGRQG